MASLHSHGAILFLFAGLMKSVVVYVCVAKERGATHMTTLEDLYYGNIHPSDRYIKRRTKVDQLVKLICKNEDALTATLTEQQIDIYFRYIGNLTVQSAENAG